MFESLQSRLEQALKKMRGQAKITEENIEEAIKEIRTAFLDADVNFAVVKKFIEDIKAKAVSRKEDRTLKNSVICLEKIPNLQHDTKRIRTKKTY